MKGTEIAEYLKMRKEMDRRIQSVIFKDSEEDKVLKEIEEEEHRHDFDRLAQEMM